MAGETDGDPSQIFAENGQVIIQCAQGMFTMTADEAVIASDRLLKAGLAAKKYEVRNADLSEQGPPTS
jgi:hypothetical protein